MVYRIMVDSAEYSAVVLVMANQILWLDENSSQVMTGHYGERLLCNTANQK
jgi:hypothetical protein